MIQTGANPQPPAGFFRIVLIVERLLRGAILLCLALLLFYPVLPAILFESPLLSGLAELQGSHGWAMVAFWLQRLDAGGQMGLGPWVFRALCLVVVGLPGVFPSLTIPLPRRLLIALACFHTLSLTSGIYCSHPYEGIREALDALLVTGLAIRVAQMLNVEELGQWLSIIPLVAALHMYSLFYQFCYFPAADGQMRGAFHHPNMLATYLLLAAPIVLLRALRQTPDQPKSMWSDWIRAGHFALFGFLVAAVILSGSRQAMLVGALLLSFTIFILPVVTCSPLDNSALLKQSLKGIGLTLASVALWVLALRTHLGPGAWLVLPLYALPLLARLREIAPRRPFEMVASLLLSALLVVSAQHLSQSIGKQKVDVLNRGSQIVQDQATSVSARAAFWGAGMREVADHPWLGVGPGGFHRYYPQYQLDCRWFSKFPHSLPIAVLCENGWPAFACMLITVFLSLRLLLTRLGSDDSPARLLRLSAFLSLLALQMVSSLDVQWQFTTFPIALGFLLGCTWLPGAPPASVPPADDDDQPDSLSPWTIRPQVLINQALCALLLMMQLLNFWGAEAEYFHQVSKVAMEQKRPKEAALLSRNAISLNPWQGEYYHQLGLIYLSLNSTLTKEEHEQLVRAAHKSCYLDSHRAVHWDLLAKTMLLDKKTDEAIVAARQALTLDCINYPSFYESLAQIHTSQGDKDTARLLLQGALQRFPTNILEAVFDFRAESLRKQISDLYCQLAELYHPQKNPKLAEPLYAEALKLDANSFYGQLGEGVCLYELARYKEAIPYLEAARTRDPELSVIHGLLSDSYKQMGRTKEAEESAKIFTKLHSQGK